ASADQCDARAFRNTDSANLSGNVSRGNHYKAVRVGTTTKPAIAASFAGMYDVLMDGDTLEADTNNVEIASEGGRNVTLRNVTFVEGSNPASNYATFVVKAGETNTYLTSTRRSMLTVQDPRFLNGASANSYIIYPIGYNGWAVPVDFFLQWTYNLTVRT